MGWKEAHRTAAGTGQRPPGRGPSDAPPRESSSHSRTPAACTIATPAPPEARPPEGISEPGGGRPAAEPGPTPAGPQTPLGHKAPARVEGHGGDDALSFPAANAELLAERHNS